MNEDPMDVYGDDAIKSGHANISRWLKTLYIILPIWGIISFYFFWNGTTGWSDRGYWHQLQKASNTTYPFNHLDSEEKKTDIKDPLRASNLRSSEN